MTPEARARLQIDRKLVQAGWVVQDMKQLNLAAGPGVAVREYPTDSGPADYVLFVRRHAVGVIEAKKDSLGENLTAAFACIQILRGQYGPYITDGKKNAKIPKDREPASLTEAECVELIAAAPEKRGQFGKVAKAMPAKKAAAKKAPVKKAATKKKAAKKTTVARKATAKTEK